MTALGSGWDAAHRKLRATEEALAVAVTALRKIRLGHPCDLPHVIAQVALEEVAGARPADSLILKGS